MKKNKELVLKLFKKYRNFILYSLIGFSGVFIDMITFLILFNLLNIDKNISTTISTSLGITNNFILNAVFNFKVKDKIFIRFITFYGVGMVGLVLTLVIFYIFVDVLKLNANIVKAGSIIIVVIVQYTLNKKLSFKKFS